VAEKSQIQALDRTMPEKVTAALKPRHRNQEFLAFLKQVARANRDVVDDHRNPVELHLVMDNYVGDKHPNVKSWLAKIPRFVLHFTRPHASWMNLVEVWFSMRLHRRLEPAAPPLLLDTNRRGHPETRQT
jgi:hypothetical protein